MAAGCPKCRQNCIAHQRSSDAINSYDAQMDSNQKQAVLAWLLLVSQGSAEDAGTTTNGASAVATGVGGHDRVAVSVSASGGTASVTVPFEIA